MHYGVTSVTVTLSSLSAMSSAVTPCVSQMSVHANAVTVVVFGDVQVPGLNH